MFTPTEFARLCHVSLVDLRRFAAYGLLKPPYTMKQVKRLNSIIVLDELGFTSQQMTLMLPNITPDELRTILRLNQAKKHYRINDDHRLNNITARIDLLDNPLPKMDLHIASRPARTVASVKSTLIAADSSLRDYYHLIVPEIRQWLRYNDVGDGPALMGFRESPFGEDTLILETGIICETPVPRMPRSHPTLNIALRRLHAVPVMACVRCSDRWLDVLAAHLALGHWLENHSYQMTGDIYEQHNARHSDVSIQIPVQRDINYAHQSTTNRPEQYENQAFT